TRPAGTRARPGVPSLRRDADGQRRPWRRHRDRPRDWRSAPWTINAGFGAADVAPHARDFAARCPMARRRLDRHHGRAGDPRRADGTASTGEHTVWLA